MAGTYETACMGKDKHRTKLDADHQAVKRKVSGSNKSNKHIHSYRCEFCKFWHVGNSNHDKRKPYKRHKMRPQW